MKSRQISLTSNDTWKVKTWRDNKTGPIDFRSGSKIQARSVNTGFGIQNGHDMKILPK